MREEAFQIPLAGGLLCGHRGGDGPPALLLHGGPALPDYTEGCAQELAGLFATIRHTQRGTPPSTVGPPYSVETIAGCGHFPWLEQPGELRRAVQRFLGLDQRDMARSTASISSGESATEARPRSSSFM